MAPAAVEERADGVDYIDKEEGNDIVEEGNVKEEINSNCAKNYDNWEKRADSVE